MAMWQHGHDISMYSFHWKYIKIHNQRCLGCLSAIDCLWVMTKKFFIDTAVAIPSWKGGFWEETPVLIIMNIFISLMIKNKTLPTIANFLLHNVCLTQASKFVHEPESVVSIYPLNMFSCQFLQTLFRAIVIPVCEGKG